MSEYQWNHFKIVPQGHNHCQLSIVNCQFGEAAKFPFHDRIIKTDNHNSPLPLCRVKRIRAIIHTKKRFRFLEALFPVFWLRFGRKGCIISGRIDFKGDGFEKTAELYARLREGVLPGAAV